MGYLIQGFGLGIERAVLVYLPDLYAEGLERHPQQLAPVALPWLAFAAHEGQHQPLVEGSLEADYPLLVAGGLAQLDVIYFVTAVCGSLGLPPRASPKKT